MQLSRDGHGTEVITVAVIIIVATSYKAPITHRHSSLSLSHALPHLVFTSTLRGRGYYYPRFIRKHGEAQLDFQGHMAGKW